MSCWIDVHPYSCGAANLRRFKEIARRNFTKASFKFGGKFGGMTMKLKICLTAIICLWLAACAKNPLTQIAPPAPGGQSSCSR